jgi:phenylalanyl-tRNA synthetase beta chain
MLIPKRNLASDYHKAIEKTDQKLITGVELIDEYTGDKIAEDKRGLTYSITYQAPDRTLTDAEVETVHKQVLERLKQNGAEIR